MNEAPLIARAVEVLRRGGLVAFPTETVYGLGADAQNELAVRRIFAVKGRPSSHPLIVHLPDARSVPQWAHAFPEPAKKLAAAFWPGPLTLVLPGSGRAAEAVSGGQNTVALRVPSHPVARELLHAFANGIAAPSANRYGAVSPTTAEHVQKDLGDQLDLIIDGGACPIGIESTIVDVSSGTPQVLRPGAVTREELKRVLGQSIPVYAGEGLRAPGRMRWHYAPRAGVELVNANELGARAQALLAQERKLAVVAPEPMVLPAGAQQFPIGADPAEFARALYATFRKIDELGFDLILVIPPSTHGLGWAVFDRLARASGSKGIPVDPMEEF
jgi:L-threonylcarbamoyladenylate synthase